MKFNKHERFSIRKFKVGAASVLLGTFGVMLASNAVDIQDINVVKVAKASDSAVLGGSADEAKKQQVISDLLAKLEAKWKEIEASINELTKEEQDKARQQKELLITAINNKISSSTNKENLDSEEKNFISAISDFKDISARPIVKPSAKNEINTAYISKKNELKDNEELLNKLESLKADALSAIQNDKSDADVTREKREYLNKISALKILTDEEKKLEEAKKSKIAELINTVELKWKEVEPKRKEYTPKDYERIELIKKNLLTNIRKDIEKVTSNQELINEDNKYSVPVNEFDKYILPKEKPEARKEIEEVYKIKEKELEKSEYLLGRLKTLKKEAEDKILEVDTDIELEDIRDNYKIRINSLDVNNEDKERLNEDKDKTLVNLLSKLKEKWEQVGQLDLRTYDEDAEATLKMIDFRDKMIKLIKETSKKEDLNKLVESYTKSISEFTVPEPKFKPKAIQEIEDLYESKKDKLVKDFISFPKLNMLKDKAIEEIKRANYEKEIESEKNKCKDMLSKVDFSNQYKALDKIEKEASDKSSIISNSISISDENKDKALKEILDILTNFKDKVTSGRDIDNLEQLVDKAKNDIDDVKLRLFLPSITNKLDDLIKSPESLNNSFDLEQPFLGRLRIDLKALYKNQNRVLGDGSSFIGLNSLQNNSVNNNAIIKYYENYVYESISESIISDIKANILGGYNVEIINKLLKDVEKNNRSYVETLDKDYKNFGISHFTLENEKIDSVVKLLSNQIMEWKSLIPKLDTLNEKVKENKNITEEEAKRILGLIKDEPKNPEASQPEVSKPEETAPIKPAPEKTPVPEKEIPKKPEMAPVPPKVGTPELGDNKQPEVSHPDVNKPGETKPKQPTPEVAPKVPEKEAPKPGQPEMIPAPPKMETPEVEDNKQPEASKPEKDNSKDSNPETSKPEETVPSKPAPEVTPKAPEKATPKEPEMGQPKPEKPSGETKPKENTPNKPEVLNPEVSQPGVNKPEETAPSKPTPEVTPKAPEKEMPKPEKPSGETKPKENTPNKPESSNPEVSQPDVNKPGEIKPKQPTPEVMPKSPEKETPKEPEIGQPKPGKPEASKPEMDKAKNEKPKGEGPKGEQLSPKEQGSTSTKQELTKQVGDSVVTVIIEDSRKLDLQAKDVTAENKEFIQYKLNDKSATIKVFDLELLDFNNKSIIKSDKERTVKIVVTENIANKEVSVYYVDKATGQLVKVPAIVNGNTIVFNTNHFSSYGLVISDKEKSKTTSTTKTSNKTLPNTGATTNNMLGILGIAATVVIATRRKRLKK